MLKKRIRIARQSSVDPNLKEVNHESSLISPRVCEQDSQQQELLNTFGPSKCRPQIYISFENKEMFQQAQQEEKMKMTESPNFHK